MQRAAECVEETEQSNTDENPNPKGDAWEIDLSCLSVLVLIAEVWRALDFVIPPTIVMKLYNLSEMATSYRGAVDSQ